MSHQRLKTKQMPIRWEPSDHSLIQFAAELLSEDVSHFVRQAALVRAKQVIRDSQSILATAKHDGDLP